MEDTALLQEYACTASESAFAALVERHVGLVYSAACRQMRDPQLAEDVTQAVFIILAKKAAQLRHRSGLTGWLYETTRFTSTRLLRTRVRQSARDQEAYMQSTLNEPEVDAAWRQLAPHLEDAMSRLAERDRTLLALRFYENQSGPEAAAAVTAGGIPANPGDFEQKDQIDQNREIQKKIVPDAAWANEAPGGTK